MVELTASEAGFDEHGTSESIRPRTRGLPPVDYVSLVGKRSKKSNEYVPEPAPRPKEPRPQRRPRKNELSPDQLEAETARLVGLNPTQPEEEEQALLPPGVNENSYVKVRNHVLARWRADVTTHLSEEDAGQRILPKWQHLVSLAWRFLDLWGYINFGVAPALLQDPNPVPSQATIIVVGAGLAGAAAARQLCRWGYRVVVLEGRSRPGGRVWTLRMEEEGLAGMADLGGAIITGIDGNPLAVLARQLGLPMHRITDRCPLYLPGGEEAPKDLDDKVLAQHNALLDAADKYREELPGEVADNVSVGAALRMLWAEVPREPGAEDLHERLMHWHFANVEFANAAQLGTLSLRHWDQDDPYEMLGSHVFVPGGNLQLVGGLLQDVPVFYNTPVTSITHSRQGVTVNSQQAAFQADAVLVTVPLGVLKRNALRFSPPLSSAKQDAIHRLGFGVLNKLVMLFPHAFWDQGLDTLGQVAADPQDAGLFFLFYAYPPHLAGTGAILAALVSGASAQRFESVPVEQAVERVMAALRAAHEGKGVVVPDPLQAVATRWAADPMCYGSYSSVAVGATGEDYDTLAMDVRGRLFFAGEATISKWPATMHGAFLSGLREAAKIRMAMERQQHMKRAGYMTRAQLASLADSDGEGDADLGGESDEEQEELDSEQEGRPPALAHMEGQDEEEQQRQQAAAAAQRKQEAAQLRAMARAERAARQAQAAAAGAAAVVAYTQAASALKRLFNELEPDVEFGCCAAFLGPASAPASSGHPGGTAADAGLVQQSMEGNAPSVRALLQVDVGSMRSGPRRALTLYTVLSRAQLSAVRNAPGGDEGRVALLARDSNIKLVGRFGLAAEVVELLGQILQARGKAEWYTPPPPTLFASHVAGSAVLGQNGSAAAEVAQPPSGSVETPQSGQWASPAPVPGAGAQVNGSLRQGTSLLSSQINRPELPASPMLGSHASALASPAAPAPTPVGQTSSPAPVQYRVPHLSPQTWDYVPGL